MSTTATFTGGDRVGHRPPVERGEQVVDRQLGHPLPGGVGGGADVRGDEHAGSVQHRVVGRRAARDR